MSRHTSSNPGSSRISSGGSELPIFQNANRQPQPEAPSLDFRFFLWRSSVLAVFTAILIGVIRIFFFPETLLQLVPHLTYRSVHIDADAEDTAGINQAFAEKPEHAVVNPAVHTCIPSFLSRFIFFTFFVSVAQPTSAGTYFMYVRICGTCQTSGWPLTSKV